MPTSVSSGSSISSISGYKAFGEAQYGDNDDSTGSAVAECLVGATGDATAIAQRKWGDMAIGLDTGLLVFSFVCNSGGGTNGVGLSVAGSTPGTIYCSNASYSVVTSVKVRAGARLAGVRVAISSIVATFYRNSIVTDTVSYPGPAIADTMSNTDPIEQETIVTLSPSHAANRVAVAFYFQFEAFPGLTPPANGLFAQAYLF